MLKAKTSICAKSKVREGKPYWQSFPTFMTFWFAILFSRHMVFHIKRQTFNNIYLHINPLTAAPLYFVSKVTAASYASITNLTKFKKLMRNRFECFSFEFCQAFFALNSTSSLGFLDTCFVNNGNIQDYVWNNHSTAPILSSRVIIII